MPEKTRDFGNELMRGDAKGNVAVLIELAVHVIFFISASVLWFWYFDGWLRMFALVSIVIEIIQFTNAVLAAKATHITVHKHGVKGVSLDTSNIIVFLFWCVFKTKEFEYSHGQILSVSEDKFFKCVILKTKKGTEYRCPVQDTALIASTIRKHTEGSC